MLYSGCKWQRAMHAHGEVQSNKQRVCSLPTNNNCTENTHVLKSEDFLCSSDMCQQCSVTTIMLNETYIFVDCDAESKSCSGHFFYKLRSTGCKGVLYECFEAPNIVTA